MLAGGLAGYPLVGAGSEAPAELTFAGLGAAGAAFALSLAPQLLVLALFSFACEYLTHQLVRGLPPSSAIGYGVGLLVLCELVTWSASLAAPMSVEVKVAVQRALVLLGTALGAAIVSFDALLGGSITMGSALVAALIGVAGSVGLLALARVLVSR